MIQTDSSRSAHDPFRWLLDVARPLWAQAQNKVLREIGTTAWHDAERRLARLLHVAVEKRRLGRDAARGREWRSKSLEGAP